MQKKHTPSQHIYYKALAESCKINCENKCINTIVGNINYKSDQPVIL